MSAAVRAGYKLTEVGVIPEDWEVKPLKDFAVIKGGKRLPLGKSVVSNITSHPYLRVTDMIPGGVELRDIKYVPDDVFPAIKNYRISTEDIFISVAGTLGVVGKIPHVIDGANLTENADKVTSIACNQDFLLYNLLSDRIQGIIESEKTVGAQPKLAIERIENFVIALPPTHDEQRAIATALSEVDALLAKLEALIAKKRDLKTATMQQLLTGQTRLPGFSGAWEVKRLGDVANVAKGSGLSKNQLSVSGANQCILYGELFTTYKCVINAVVSKTNSSEGLGGLRGDILLPGSTTTKGIDLAVASALMVEDVFLGGDINVVRKKNSAAYNSEFMANLLTHTQKLAIADMAQGSTIIHLYGRNLLGLALLLPSMPEQTAIATLLSDMDAELTALEARRDKTRALKQGMMQVLLTGEIRLL